MKIFFEYLKYITKHKKRKALSIHTFLRGIKICIQNSEILVLNFDLPMGTPYPKLAMTIPRQGLEIYLMANFKEKI